MRPLTHLVTPWLLAIGLVGSASPSMAQVVVGGHVGISVGSPGTGAQPYPPPPPRRARPAPGYPDSGYPAPYPGAAGWALHEPAPWAFEAGYYDGYQEGLRDGRRGRWYDPIGQKQFRRANRGYHREYGPQSFYQQHYRRGFRRGYERGYRQALYPYPDQRPRGQRRPW
ncbi:MAG: hypothetical protein H6Q08_1433 [Acidobacteria bacterium]|jgi:hypothetical protein|nr:hypothetical protein [Acidobacteriota bacterium]